MIHHILDLIHQYVKTSPGFGPGGATINDVDLIYRTASPVINVKTSGGIRSLTDAQAMIQAGASRLGTRSGVNNYKDALA